MQSNKSKLLITVILSLLFLGTFIISAHAFTNGQSATLVIGQKDFTSKDQATSQSGLAVPQEVGFDSSGNMWVMDYLNYRVLEFRPPFATGMEASLVIGQPNYTAAVSASAPPATDSGFYEPGLFVLDSSDNMWIADHGNNRVLEFKPPFSTGMSASLVIGQKEFTTGFPATAKDGLLGPQAVAFDHSGNLWVPDAFNNGVLEFTSTPIPEFPTASLAIIAVGSLAVVALVLRKFPMRLVER